MRYVVFAAGVVLAELTSAGVRSQLESPAEADEVSGLGLGGGGKQIQVCKEHFEKLLKSTIKLASLQVCSRLVLLFGRACRVDAACPSRAKQTAFQTLDEAIKLTNRRVNALDNVRVGCR